MDYETNGPRDEGEPPPLGEYDVVIIGGGPAGLACALTLRRYAPALRVALVESTAYDTPRLGENVSSALLAILEYLDVKDRFLAQAAHVESSAVWSCWGQSEPLPQHAMRHWSGEGFQLDRGAFDAMLAEAFHERGGKLYLSCRVDSIQPAGVTRIAADDPDRRGRLDAIRTINDAAAGYRLQVRHAPSGKCFALATRFLVDASGRRATFARKLGARTVRHDTLIGVARLFRTRADVSPSPNAVERARTSPNASVLARTTAVASSDILIEATPDGWWYSAPLPDHRLIVTWMTDAALWREALGAGLARWESRLSQASRSHARVRRDAIEAEEQLIVRPAHSQILDRAVGADWLAVGDAAASFDPLSSLGIGFAMHSASHAALAIASVLLDGDPRGLHDYGVSVRRQFADYLPMWNRHYQAEGRYRERLFWRERQAA